MKITRLDHVSFALADAGATGALLQRLLGLPETLDIEFNDTRKIVLDMGNAGLELLQGKAPGSRTSAWLARHGPGFFHLCLEVADLDEAMRDLAAQGVALLDAAPVATHGGGRAVFADPATTGGILFEFKEPPAGDADA